MDMETDQIYQIDVGNLLAFNPNHRFSSAPSSRFVLFSPLLQGKVGYQHAYVDFSNLQVTVPRAGGGGSETVKTCPAAMGFGFAAGTTDGPGAFDFKQGDDKGNAFWRLVRNVLKTPGPEQVQCQKPKPILLDTGEMKTPYDWAPSILPVQMLRIGQLVILSVPGEFTTMAGRRLRDAVKSFLISLDNKEFGNNLHVVIAGLTNTYSQYITTYEEYEVQRYEGASTLYGPHTLTAYIQEFKKLATALVNGQTLPSGPQPPDLLDKQISLLAPVVVDSTPLGVSFGDVKADVPPKSTFRRGQQVNATFWSGCPQQVQCQKPKPILLDTGEMKTPYDWAPSILPVQMLRIGQLVILSVPGEFTTMAGRRLRDAVKSFLISLDSKEFGNNLHVVIAGLTNTYSQYITTYEEYEVQRYEGASTLYGPHTLTAYIQEFKKLATALVNGQTLPSGPQPPDLLDKQISLLAPVVVDSTPLGVSFGDVKADVPPKSTFRRALNY
ncbi:hypothetical protein F2Q69_00017577 [Brassica cretica]|uniref:Neutral ceramidase n=1 Tax=Brassica cretica TaxID=69181 RepID=A0A8S9QQS5_BRACR|nr:hypothetical protein F2Q69_00017577 [Brassica cretica]